ncbi:DUF4407 domain-containing protein [Mucilaginibacter sp. X4EP1]|jgi:hypothetical protein|uniref:DUF4407 domain-containing protein n=1 Tax=Mucilaginibacter sp. X4EP1 TaxID=2723092 RepID=UPI00216AA1E2|nr:DUF4407 domain-containing protein [Mucilaginibacter sp. X4EP1]MCS3815099.1 hypothetical protein [Mucilaginibacter sp. X4EP1]
MKDWWLKFGCFLTGYKYELLKGCSEVSHRAVKRYTAALVIICILWAFIGYSFVSKYLAADWYYSCLGAALFVLIILQVERQIILSDTQGNAKYIIRGFIAVIMAVIGSIIIDQIIFKEDIKHKESYELNAQVDSLLPARERELKAQAAETDSSISKKEVERKALVDDLFKNPTIQVASKVNNAIAVPITTTDSNKVTIVKTNFVRKTAYAVNSIQNPKMSMLAPLDEQIKEMRAIKIDQETRILKLRDEVTIEAKANGGFLYELKLMYKILRDSGPALFVWALWALLLLGIEIFIMVNKMTHVETDYDVSIQHHMELQKRKLRLLAMQIPEVQNN